MATRRVTPPWEFLRDASKPSLESFELSRLNNAANLRREITALLDQWIEDNSQALLARWVRDRRSLPPSEAISREEMPQKNFPSQTLRRPRRPLLIHIALYAFRETPPRLELGSL